MTIRGRILVAFLVMSMITAALGGYAAWGIKDAGILVDKTYDESLMAINYARAAATDFAAMRAAFARQWIATNSAMREKLGADINMLGQTIAEDLGVAVQRSQSNRARQAARNVQRAVDAWKTMSEHLLDGTKLDASWATLDRHAGKVDEEIDLLVNYTAGDGFLYRQSARATVARDLQLNIAGTVLALLLSALVAWALSARIVGPVAAASNVAERIATGRLDVAIPRGSADELGNLLASMGSMRDNIKMMMEREVAPAPLRAGAPCRRTRKLAGRRGRGGRRRATSRLPTRRPRISSGSPPTCSSRARRSSNCSRRCSSRRTPIMR